MTKWTPQQEDAIQTRGRSIIVSAAAGSGKTAVLVERLLRILSDTETRVPAESIVVVTFTNDAAAQMKQRLYQVFSQKLAQLSPDDEETYCWLLRQQSALGSAKISTINAFCFQLLRENADACGIPASFRVCEPSEERVYAQQAMEQVIAAFSRTRPDDMQLLCAVLCAQNDDEIEPYIRALAGYLRSVAFPTLWLRRARTVAGDAGLFLQAALSSLRERILEIAALAEQTRPFAEDIVAGKNPFTALLEQDIMQMKFHADMLVPVHYESYIDSPRKHEAAFGKLPGRCAGADADAKAFFRQMRDFYKSAYTKTVDRYTAPLHYLREDLALEAQVVPLLLDLTEQYLDALFEEKKRRGVLSFDDGERLALQLLSEVDEEGRIAPSAAAKSLSAQYSIIMVDEYQDSNNKQDCLFKLLSKNGVFDEEKGRMRYGTNAFLVGDVKQSIYSFRLANPRNFIDAIEDSTPLADCADAEDIARIYLSRNFRSSEGVIDFVNALFRQVMTPSCGEVEYNENEYLNFGAKHYGGRECPTTLLFPDEAADIPEEQDLQAVCTADTIADMLARRVPVIGFDGSERPCTPKDFCILLRSVKNEATAFIDALKDRGIAAECSDTEGSAYLSQPEIRLITNFLRVIDNPLADVPLASVLLSPVYGFTSEDLLTLRLYAKRSRLYLQLRSCAEEDAAEPDIRLLSQKCRAFLAQLEILRETADAKPLDALITAIYDETDLLSLQSMFPNAAQRRSQLESYVRLAQGYRAHGDLEGRGNLAAWLQYLDSLLAIGSDLEVEAGPDTDADCVSIKTIHKSKGLEFPFVFLAHLQKKFSTVPSHELILPGDNGMIGLQCIDKASCQRAATASLQHLLREVYAKQKSEEMRLFYVALTRAKQQLFLLIGRTRKRGMTNPMKHADLLERFPQMLPELCRSALCMEDWVHYFLLSTTESERFRLAIEDGVESRSDMVHYLPWNGTHTTEAQPEVQPERTALPDPERLSAIRSQLGFRYASPLSQLISKHSVTSLAHPEQTLTQHLQEPEFLTESGETKLRGARRGTAVHKMLQHMDFAAAAEDPAAELARLTKAQLLTTAESEALGMAHLEAFLRSELYRRIAASPQVQKEQQLFVRIGELNLPEDTPLLRQYAGTDGILIGTMDLLFREGDGWVLVDYKTDRNKTAEQLRETYSLQLGLYQKAIEHILGEPVREAYLYSFTLDAAVPVDLETIDFSQSTGIISDTQ